MILSRILALLLFGGLTSVSAEEKPLETLHVALAGDSTVAKHPSSDVESGWGEFLGEFLKPEASISNFARGGASSKSFTDAKLWDRVIQSKPNYVFIQFGHNDQPGKGPARETIPSTTYTENLKKFIREVRKIGGKPVLVTSVARRVYVNGKIHPGDLWGYVEATRAVGKAENVPVLDLHHKSVLLFNFKGQKFCQLYGSSLNDSTHFSLEGARMMARLVAEEIEIKVPELKPWLQLQAPLPKGNPFQVKLETVAEGYDGETCWVHARAGWISGANPKAVMTLQKLLMKGSDVFFELNDLSKAADSDQWSKVQPHVETLGRRTSSEGLDQVICDFTPKYHAVSGRLLGTGHTAQYRDGKVAPNQARSTAYSIYDEKLGIWTTWESLKMPNLPQFYNSGAGCTQRVDLENGDILLPIYHKEKDGEFYRSTVLRCRLVGNELQYVSHGKEVKLESGRGVYEPSLVRFQDKFYLTLRNDTSAYVAVSDDGQNFGPLQAWKFDDLQDLGNYNTQQHWLRGGGKLYLVYTRSGAHNDHVVRHRAPLFMAEVDPQTLHLKRATEVVVVPEHGARLGNFGITEVSENESWVTVTEWMQSHSPNYIIPVENAFGAKNRVFVSKIRWESPN